MIGILVKMDNRPDVIFEDGSFYGGLHCGACFSIFDPVSGWLPVRLEFTEDWVLLEGTGFKPFQVPYGRQVKL